MVHLDCYGRGEINKKKATEDHVFWRHKVQSLVSQNAHCTMLSANYVLLLFHVQLQRAGKKAANTSLFPFHEIDCFVIFFLRFHKMRERAGATCYKSSSWTLEGQKVIVELLGTLWQQQPNCLNGAPQQQNMYLIKPQYCQWGKKLFNLKPRLQSWTEQRKMISGNNLAEIFFL